MCNGETAKGKSYVTAAATKTLAFPRDYIYIDEYARVDYKAPPASHSMTWGS